MPRHITPMLAKATDLPDDLDAWAFEVKWDGMRAVIYVEGGTLRIETRTKNEVTAQYPELAGLPDAVGRDVVLDGEIVAYDAAGKPSFQQLQSRFGLTSPTTIATRAAATPVQYLAFDLLELDGRDLEQLPYEERRALLTEILGDADSWRVPAYHVGHGDELLEAVVEQGLEGVVAKRLGSPYREGSRSGDWRKIKVQRRQEFIVCGWTEGAGRRDGGIGALVLGYHDDGQLQYAGNVGTGFSDQMLRQLAEQLEPLARTSSPFDESQIDKVEQPGKWKAMRGARGAAVTHYVDPVLVCEVEFTEFTRDGTLRHPSFQGMRFDKAAADVVREEPS